jgi:hypothetical protein
LFSDVNNITRQSHQIFNSKYFHNSDVLKRSMGRWKRQPSICTDIQNLMFIFLITYKYTLYNPVVWNLLLHVKITIMKRLFMFVCFCCNSPLPSGPGLPHSRGIQITHNDAPPSVGLLWTSDQFVAETCLPDNTQYSQ